MPLNPNPIGAAIADYFISNRPADGTQITQANLEAIWQGVMTLIYNDIKANMDVIPTSHGATPLEAATPIPVTVNTSSGVGATTAVGPLVGTGSVI